MAYLVLNVIMFIFADVVEFMEMYLAVCIDYFDKRTDGRED